VSLTGASSSDADGTIASYAWTQTAGSTVSLAAASSVTPGFTAPSSAGALSFRLTVTDNGGASHSDTVTVTVNAPPVANAGADQTVQAGAAVSLNGSGADSDGTIASYAWTQTGGDAVTLNGASTATPAFTAPAAAASLAFQLTVTDNQGASHSDSVLVTVNALPPPPPPPAAPVIARQPTSPRALEHGSALIFVVASGDDLIYEWHSRNFGTIVRTGPEPFVLRTGLDASDDGNCYYAVISNSAGSVTSEPGCLTVYELQGDIDPYDDNLGDDESVASGFGNTLMGVAQLVAGALTGPSLEGWTSISGIISGMAYTLETPYSCYGDGAYVGATLDGVAVTNAMFLPLGRHTVSHIWNECRNDSDDLNPINGGMLIDYDFPERYGEGSVTIHVSGYGQGGGAINGTLLATLTANTGTSGNRWDDIQITIDEDFSNGSLRVTSAYPQTISIERRYTNDSLRIDEAIVDFDASMTVYDSEGAAGSVYQKEGGLIRLRENLDVGDTGEPDHTSTGQFVVGMSGDFTLATLEAGYGQRGWFFSVLPPPECPDEPGDTICVDPPPLP